MLVSIIIPCHNSAGTIKRAIESVFSQTWENWELILVNNNSTDNTLDILHDIKSTNDGKAIKVLDEKKKGAPAARNRGLLASNGTWIQFLDADDELLPEKLETQISSISEDIDAIYSPYFVVKGIGVESTTYIIKDDIWKALMMSKIGITSSNLFKKAALIAVNGWDEHLSSSQDAALALALLKNDAVFLASDHHLTNIYATDSSITRTKDLSKIKSIIHNYINVRKDILEFLESKKIDIKTYRSIYNRVFADCYLWYCNAAPFYTWRNYNMKTRDNLIGRLKTNYSFFRKWMDK